MRCGPALYDETRKLKFASELNMGGKRQMTGFVKVDRNIPNGALAKFAALAVDFTCTLPEKVSTAPPSAVRVRRQISLLAFQFNL